MSELSRRVFLGTASLAAGVGAVAGAAADFHQGDAGYVPRGYGHYIENVGDEPLGVLIGFNSRDYQEISLSTWLAANRDAVIADNFKVDDSLVAKLPKNRVFIASKDGPDA
jgi:oxalate decarboxylase